MQSTSHSVWDRVAQLRTELDETKQRLERTEDALVKQRIRADTQSESLTKLQSAVDYLVRVDEQNKKLAGAGI